MIQNFSMTNCQLSNRDNIYLMSFDSSMGHVHLQRNIMKFCIFTFGSKEILSE